MRPRKKLSLSLFASNGIVSLLSLDRAGPIKQHLSSTAPGAVLDFKREALELLSPISTATLLDADSLKRLRKSRQQFTNPIILSLEASGFSEKRGERITRIQLRPADARKLGASAAKLQMHYNPRYMDSAEEQLELAKVVKKECDSAGLPLLLELPIYEVPASMYEHAVFEAAEKFSPHCDLLISDFPSSSFFIDTAIHTCLRFSRHARVPWLLTGYVVEPEQFHWRLEAACRGGASGFVAGSAVWVDAVQTAPKERRAVLDAICAGRLLRFRRIAEKNGIRL